MTSQHPITQPPELVASLRNSAPHGIRDAGVTREIWLISKAYQAGADQELEACCKWLPKLPPWSADDLRRHRRPKQPSLKDQALALVEQHEDCWRPSPKDWDTIRRALDALDD